MISNGAHSPGKAVALQIEVDGKPLRLELVRKDSDSDWTAVVDGEQSEIDARLVQHGILSLIIDGRSFRCVLDEGPVETAIQINGHRYTIAVEDPRSLAGKRKKAGAAGGMQLIKAPMPGRVVRLLVEAGDQVVAQQGVVVIEAMKMQNELKATRPGRVAEIRTEAGATVNAGATLLLIE